MIIAELATVILRPRWRPIYYFKIPIVSYFPFESDKKLISRNMFKRFIRDHKTPVDFLSEQGKMYNKLMIEGRSSMLVSGRRSGKSLLWKVQKSGIHKITVRMRK